MTNERQWCGVLRERSDSITATKDVQLDECVLHDVDAIGGRWEFPLGGRSARKKRTTA